MKYERYPVEASDDYRLYLFFSDGPKGRIAKGIMYSPRKEALPQEPGYIKWALEITLWKSRKNSK